VNDDESDPSDAVFLPVLSPVQAANRRRAGKISVASLEIIIPETIGAYPAQNNKKPLTWEGQGFLNVKRQPKVFSSQDLR
jgi:hypothetical protein